MKIFLSHSTKNEEIVLEFASFLESVAPQIEVFCSSERGSIIPGANFVDVIFKNLDACDVFIPVLSEEYYQSKFCMIELGVAFAYMYNRYAAKGEEYIVPMALYPVKKGEALANTPMSNIQVGDLNDENDIQEFLKDHIKKHGIHVGAGTNRKIHAFKTEIDKMIMKKQDIFAEASIVSCFNTEGVFYKQKDDIVSHVVNGQEILVNYNMDPYAAKLTKEPDFISLVLKYVDKLNLRKYLNLSEQAEIQLVLTNEEDTLKQVNVEFKYGDNKDILRTFLYPLSPGENHIHIPLKEMLSKALENISQICFVIHPEDVRNKAGSIRIKDITIGATGDGE